MSNRSVNFLLKLSVLSALLMFTIPGYAQAIYSIKVKLSDAKTSEPVAYATASVSVKGESSALKYVLTDANGEAVIPKLKKGTYVFKAELMGYKSFQQEVAVDKNIDLGTVKMHEDAEVLDAAKISDVGNPIVVKKDTIEYNASSFKTSENDMLEELLKKLPGVEVEADGTITANGETIKKITIDGKTFFLDDPQLASKNIPAKMIEKVKVVEKKSDQAQFTGIDDGEEETVIDLSMKQGMMQGWFGNVMAGGGHDVPGAGSDMNDMRYQGAAMMGRFTDKSQVSVILNGNNTNNRGFNDMAGSMMQGMRGGGGMGRGMGGWGRGNGITTSWMGGLNGAFTLLDDKMDLAGNYLYNGSDNFVEEEIEKIILKDGGVRQLSHETGHGDTFTQGNRFGVRLEHEFSDNTSILFEPQFNFGSGNFSEYSDFTTWEQASEAADTVRINDGWDRNQGWNDSWSTSGFLLFRQKLGKAGRTISANVRYSLSDNNLLGSNQSHTNVFTQGQEPDVDVNQYYDQNTSASSLNGRIVYTEPLGKGFFFEANYMYSWNRNKSVKNVWDGGTVGNDLIIPDKNSMESIINSFAGLPVNKDYSNTITNISQNHRAGFNVSYQREKLRAQLGFSANPTTTRNITNGVDTSYTVVNFSPQAMLNYEFNDNTNLRFFYFGRSAQPSTSQLMPVPDNSNPRNVSLGNPYLNPYFNHNLRGNFGYTNKQTFTSVHARFGASLVENAITNAQWYDQSGVGYSIPVNGPGTGSADIRLMVNSPFGKSGFSIFSMTYARYNQSTSYVGKNTFDTDRYYDGIYFDYEAFHRDYLIDEDGDVITLSKSKDFVTNKTQTMSFTQRLRLTYRNDIVEVTLGGRTIVNKSWYTMENSNLSATWNNQIDGSMNWTIPGGVHFKTDVDYNWYNGYTTPKEDEIILNAEITKLLFKDKFTLALKTYDILGQSKNLSVSDTANYHTETRNNTLGRYVILSLTYRFGTFGGGSGGRGPMRGPMGGPPRM